MAPTTIAPVDVAIIGAGLSGLSAAQTFQMYNVNAARPIDYVVLEADDRVGGKTHAVPAVPNSMIDEVIGGVVDEGATFINDKYHTCMTDLAHKYHFDIEVQYQKGDLIMARKNESFKGPPATFGISDPVLQAQLAAFLEYIDESAASIDIHNHDTAHARHLDSMTWSDYVKDFIGYTPLLGEFATDLARSVVSRETDEMSALFWLDYTKSNVNTEFLSSNARNGAQYQRVRQGAGSFAVKMSEELQPGSIHLNTPVTEIIQEASGAYTIRTAGHKTFRAQQVILSVTSALWHTIRFSPALPPPKQALARATALGRLTKALAVWDRPWWRAHGLSGSFVAAQGPVASTQDTSVPPDHQWTLTGFIGGDPAVAFNALDAGAQYRAFMRQLEDVFGPYLDGEAVPEPAALHLKHWNEDEWFQGAPTVVTPPGLMTSPAGLTWRDRVGNISFVGTETAYEFKGYMEGAVRSGVRGANEVFEAMGLA